MLTHLFSKRPPLECLFELLERICASRDVDYYIIDKNAYKMMIYHEHHRPFLDAFLPYYRKSRQHYVTRKLTYNSFVNLIRQICSVHEHELITDKQYNHQVYTIRYIVKKIQ